MGGEPRPRARYAVVVPDSALPAAKRVPTWGRFRLGIDVYAVHEDGRVELHGSTALTDPDNRLELVAYDADGRDERRQVAAAEARALSADPLDLAEVRAIQEDMAALREG